MYFIPFKSLRKLLFPALLLLSATASGQSRDTIFVYDTVKLYLPAPATPSEKKTSESDSLKKLTPSAETGQQNNATLPSGEQKSRSEENSRATNAGAQQVSAEQNAGKQQAGTEQQAGTQQADAEHKTTNKALTDESTNTANGRDTAPNDSLTAAIAKEPLQEESPWPPHGLRYFPIQFGLFTPAELPFPARDYLYTLSISAIGTTTGSVYGIGVAGIYHHNRFDYKGVHTSGIHSSNGGDFWGVQTSGIDGTTRGNFYGVQTAGIFAHTRGNFVGVQTAGMVNNTKGNFVGVQTAGIVNNTKGNYAGVQTAGMVNRTKGQFKGVQTSGLASITNGNMVGLQTSGIFNRAGRMSGLQTAGIVNSARTLNGVQIGLINICDSIESGFSLGLINVVRKQFYGEIDLISANYMHFGLQYSMGSRWFHTILLGGGHNMGNYNSQLVLGIGLGSQINLGRNFAISPQLVTQSYYNTAPGRWAPWRWATLWDDESESFADNWTTHLKLGFSYHIAKRVGIKFIPSIFLASDYDGYKRHIRRAESHSEEGGIVYSDGAGYSIQLFQRIGQGKMGVGLGLSGSISFRF